MDLVSVTWLDNAQLQGWHDCQAVGAAFEDVSNRTHETVGWLVFQNEDWVCVAFSINYQTFMYHEPIMIQQKCILEMEVLGHAETPPDIGD